MEQFLLHLFGDYIIQNDWMALNKKKAGIKGFITCFVHCATYSIPFLIICNPLQVLFIFLFHFAIDRTNFIKWFMTNTGKEEFMKPPMSPWSIIITDNVFHLITNYLIITLIP